MPRLEPSSAVSRGSSASGSKQDRRGRTIAIKVRLVDFTTVTRARTLAEGDNDVGVVAASPCDLLREYAPPRPVRLLGVRVASFAEFAPRRATASRR